MLLVLFFVLLILAAAYGGIVLSPLLWILVAILILAVLLGPGVGGNGWGGTADTRGRFRRW